MHYLIDALIVAFVAVAMVWMIAGVVELVRVALGREDSQ